MRLATRRRHRNNREDRRRSRVRDRELIVRLLRVDPEVRASGVRMVRHQDHRRHLKAITDMVYPEVRLPQL